MTSTQKESNQYAETGDPAAELIIQALDPRAKWLIYLLLSIGIFLQEYWGGIAFATVLTVALIAFSRVSIQIITTTSKPFILL